MTGRFRWDHPCGRPSRRRLLPCLKTPCEAFTSRQQFRFTLTAISGGRSSAAVPSERSLRSASPRATVGFRQTTLADYRLTRPVSAGRIPLAKDGGQSPSVCVWAFRPLDRAPIGACHLDACSLQSVSISRSQSRFGPVSLAGHQLCRRPLPWRLPYGSLSQSATVSLSS
jgi:hypothetical protein